MTDEEQTDQDDDQTSSSALQEEIEAFVEGATGLFDSLKDIFARSREEVVRGARLGKVRLDVYQLRKDREQGLQKLGEAAYELLQAGAIGHASLAEQLAALQEIDAKIAVADEEISELAPEDEEDEDGPHLEVVPDEPEPEPTPAPKKKAAPRKKAAPKRKAATKKAKTTSSKGRTRKAKAPKED
jgi:outer membrane biosynthesis protein TonB